MKKPSNYKNNLRSIKKYKKKLIYLGLLFFLVIVLVGFAFYYLQKKIDYLFVGDNYSPSIEIRENQPLEVEFKFNDQFEGKIFSNEIISLIDSAEQSIDIAMFAFTNKDFILALDRAVDRDVKVRIVLDKSNYDRHQPLFKEFYDLPGGNC